jgi:3-oxoacyl-[acyl-carrier-protein] synthase II
MTACIAGMGWVTPLGTGLETVWERLERGDKPELASVTNSGTGRCHPCFLVPPKAVEYLARNPRLRRSSAISYYAVAAGLAALEQAGVAPGSEAAAETAVIFAISNGGVLYTRRFFEQIVQHGANGASPMLFPETVYNAPASHLAALLGINGASYTLVGDSSVGITALHFAAQLLALGSVAQCVVVGAEECDWIVCEAYRTWRFARTPLAEGAAAVVLRREGQWKLRAHPGAPFAKQSGAAAALESVIRDLDVPRSPHVIVSSANGTFVDRAESGVLDARFPDAARLYPKRTFGEAPGASALQQTVLATLALQQGRGSCALVPVVGVNHQASAAWIEAS